MTSDGREQLANYDPFKVLVQIEEMHDWVRVGFFTSLPFSKLGGLNLKIQI